MSERRDFLRRARSSSVSLLACPKPTFALPYRDPFSESSATCSVVPLVHQICSFPPPPAALHFVPSASLNSRTSTGPVHLGQLQVGFERGKPPAPNTPKTNTPLPTPTPHASTRPPAPLPYYCTSRVCFRLVRPPPLVPHSWPPDREGGWHHHLYTAPLRTRAGDRVTPRHGHERSVNLAHL